MLPTDPAGNKAPRSRLAIARRLALAAQFTLVMPGLVPASTSSLLNNLVPHGSGSDAPSDGCAG